MTNRQRNKLARHAFMYGYGKLVQTTKYQWLIFNMWIFEKDQEKENKHFDVDITPDGVDVLKRGN